MSYGFYITFSSVLIGLGVITLLFRKNILAILFGLFEISFGIIISLLSIRGWSKLSADTGAELVFFSFTIIAVTFLGLAIMFPIIHLANSFFKNVDITQNNKIKY